MTSPALGRRDRIELMVQRTASRLTSLLWAPLCVFIMSFVMGWRIDGREEARRQYRLLRKDSRTPLLIAANHLTKVDSALIGWALGNPVWYLGNFKSLPWNLPAREHFAFAWWARLGVYLLKCQPIQRGGSREDIAHVLSRVKYLLGRGEVGLLFPEGGRSRSGRVEPDRHGAWGVGRLVKSLPSCRVMCVYLRGEGQKTWSDLPARGDSFQVQVHVFEPKSDKQGLRASVDVADQILNRLVEMESAHFDRR